tara:strand:+ start:3471 stop:3869 length:399 start_codon:yes stop_codon:yes gene_type:complete
MYTEMEDLGFGEYIYDGFYDNLDLPEFVVSEENASTFMERERHNIVPLLYEAVKKGVEEDCINVPIFRLYVLIENELMKIYSLEQPRVTMVLRRDAFCSTLEKCIAFFEETEDYELCQNCITLINKLNEDDL